MSEPTPGDGRRDDRLADLAMRYLNDMLSDDEVVAFNRLLNGDDASQELFVSFARLHGLMNEWGADLAAERGWNLVPELIDESQADAMKRSLHDAIVSPAIREDADDASAGSPSRPVSERFAADGLDDIGEAPSSDPPPTPTAGRIGTGRFVPAWALRAGLAAGIAIAASAVTWSLWPARAPAMLTATAAAVVNGSPMLAPNGVKLTPGQSLDVSEGAVELTFNRGAVVVVSAPSRIRVIDRDTIALDAGSLAAHVPHGAVGFGVSAPGLSVVDRGTDFGVRTVDGGSASEVDVFNGTVDAAGVAPDGKPGPAMVHLTAGQAVRHAAGSAEAAPVEAAYNPDAFPRDISAIRFPLLTHDTGTGRSPGAPDPYWDVIDLPIDADPKPQPAVVVGGRPRYPVRPSAERWVAPRGQTVYTYSGDYTYRTTLNIDDSRFDPATVIATADVMADHSVLTVHVNGVKVGGASLLTEAQQDPPRMATVSIPATAWHAGGNNVDVTLMYLPGNMPPDGPPGVRVAWTATVAPVVRR